MHVHAFFTNDSSRFHTTSELMFPLFVAHGVTGVRDMGSNLNAILAARDSVAAHQLIGPRMVVAGPMLDGTTSRYQTIIKVGTADDARAAVQMLKQRGVDTVAVGKLADLVILSRNPLTEIGNTRSVVAIVADGRYFSPADLGRMRLHLMELAAK
jgi:imidazolonepropionase-like amidohydrolase